MSLTARILIGFAILSLAAIYFLLNPVLDRVERQYLEAAEEPMVDTAEILAAIVAQTSPEILSASMPQAKARQLNAKIYDFLKTEVAMDVYITDADGTVIFNSANPETVGQNFSNFLDVYKTLNGTYGARSTRLDENDSTSSMMYVAAPIIQDNEIAGVLTVCKPQLSMLIFIQETRRNLMWLATVATLLFLLAGVILSRWVTRPLAQLTRYAEEVTAGKNPPAPALSGHHLKVLGQTTERMRLALEDRKYIESYVQTLTHEMKSPVAGIVGAAELLQEDLPPDQQQKFLGNIRSEADRLEKLIQQLLALASLENQRQLTAPRKLNTDNLINQAIAQHQAEIDSRNITLDKRLDASATVLGEEFLLVNAIGNVLQNAIEFSPQGGCIEVHTEITDQCFTVTISDDGPGIPDFALDRIFDRFYSLERPDTRRKSSGLGLCFVRESLQLHQGTIKAKSCDGKNGTTMEISLPL